VLLKSGVPFVEVDRDPLLVLLDDVDIPDIEVTKELEGA
jgi:hypothetical protein